MMLIRRSTGLLALTLTLLWPAKMASAQEGAKPDRPAPLGAQVSVIAHDGKRHAGKLIAMSETDVVIRTRPGEAPLTLRLAEVESIRRPSHSVRNGTLIGVFGGLSFGVLLKGMAERGTSFDEPRNVLAYAALGAGAGAGIGALIRMASKNSRTVFSASRPSTLTLLPVIDRQRLGIAGTIRLPSRW